MDISTCLGQRENRGMFLRMAVLWIYFLHVRSGYGFECLQVFLQPDSRGTTD